MFFKYLILFSSFLGLLSANPYLGKSYDHVWPKFNTQNPIILTKGTKLKAYNFKPKSKGWSSKEGYFEKEDDIGELSAIVMDPAFRFEGVSVFVFRESSDDSFPLVHELFHPFQQKRFLVSDEKSYPALYNIENQALFEIEEEILQSYCLAEGSARKTFKEEFLLIHKFRLSLLDEASQAYEDREERIEGLANYVAARITGDKTPLIRGLKGLRSDSKIVDKSLKWRFYTIGALLGFMLDEEPGDWKKEAEETPLIHLFKENLSSQDKVLKTLKLLKFYRFDERKEAVKKQIDFAQKRIEDEKRAFNDLKGRSFHIEYKSPLSSGGLVQEIIKLEDGSTLHKQLNSMAETGEWRLGLRGQPYVMITDSSQVFKETENLMIEMDGKKIPLNELNEGEIAFKKVAWEGLNSKFESKKEGTLINQPGRVTLVF